jgi:ligand-binding sensor domain-containing protein
VRPGGWTVATPAGLTLLDAGGTRSLYAFHGLVNNHVYALGPGSGRLLVGTLGGLSVLEGEVVRAGYTTSNSSLRQNWISALAPVDEEWFVGTYGAGVQRLDSAGRLSSFSDLREGFEVNPNAMAVDARQVYAGSLGRGLYVYDRASGRWTASAAGLPSLNVTAVTVANGWVYAGTDNGLVRFPQ